MEELPGLRVPPPRPSTGEVLRTTGIMVSMVALDRRYDMQSIGAGKAIRRTQSKGRRPGSTLTTREGSSEWPASRALWGGAGGSNQCHLEGQQTLERFSLQRGF